jgi:hypothetical protein
MYRVTESANGIVIETSYNPSWVACMRGHQDFVWRKSLGTIEWNKAAKHWEIHAPSYKTAAEWAEKVAETFGIPFGMVELVNEGTTVPTPGRSRYELAKEAHV